MIEIKYVCSNGEKYNLIGDKMRATSGYFHATLPGHSQWT